ncbi:MAG: GNAT family N-acetyltransferase [Chloroflexota bacterium]|nr:GNAT family N-acetyltransferase [Chloroflexota bacterium]MDQ5865629.1 GNAT family N-acetyltransferase [Chloroflexota bacterium]
MVKAEQNTRDTIALLDELAANAWPATIQQQLEVWKLRAAGGLTRRANSVYTSGPLPSYSEWLHEVQSFYTRRGLPVRFQISDGSPAELDRLLDGVGYSREAHSEVYTASAATVAAGSTRTGGPPVLATSHLEEHWLEAFLRVEGHDPTLGDMYRTIMSAIGPAARFATVQVQEEVVGVGMAVTERGWTGLFNLGTAKHMRGRGVATAIIADLTSWSLEQGAEHLYLQVMSSNEVAKRLYAKLGFSYLYGYHYRTEPGGR